MVSYQVSFDNQYKKHDAIPYSDDSSSLKDPQSWDRKSLYRSTVLGSKVFIQIHSLGIKGIAVLINTNNSTSHSNEFWNRRCPEIHSLGIKGIYLYRSTVLGSNVYMYTDQVPFKANQHWLSAQHTTHHTTLDSENRVVTTRPTVLESTAQVHQAGCRSINTPEKNTPPKVNKHSFDSY